MKAAIRATVNAHGMASLQDITPYATSEDWELRFETARSIQNVLRDFRNSRGRSALIQRDRAPWERALRAAMSDPHDKVRTLATYAAGNVGFTALSDAMHDQLESSQPQPLRQAAATGIFELRTTGRLDALAKAFLGEASEPVRFRLLLCLRRGLDIGQEPTPVIIEAIREACSQDHPRTTVLGLLLLGYCKNPSDVTRLRHEVQHSTQARARAAAASLGRLATRDAVHELVALTRHEDEARRQAAAEALGQTGHAEASEALLALVLGDEDRAVRMLSLIHI